MNRTVSGSRPAVLIVEDEAVTRLSAMDIVEGAGCEAVDAANADEAVRILEARADIRVVFADIKMPGSMDGLALICLVKNRWPSVARLMTTGQTNFAPTKLRCAAELFFKPYLPLQIEAALRRLID